MPDGKPENFIDLMMRSEKVIFAVLSLCPFVLGIPFALFSGENILLNHPLLAQFSNFMAKIAPSISGFEAQSRFPEVSKLVFSVDWLFAILFFLIAMLVSLRIWLWDRDRNNQVMVITLAKSPAHETTMRKVGLILGYLMVLSAMLTDIGLLPFVGLYGGRSIAGDSTHWFSNILASSRSGLGTGAALYCVSVALMYWGTLFVTLNIKVWFETLWKKSANI